MAMFECEVCGAREWDGETAHNAEIHEQHGYKKAQNEIKSLKKEVAKLREMVARLSK
jgi:hypothetical protein